MNYTVITISTIKLDNFQKDYLIKSGFTIMGTNLIRSVKSSEVHLVLGQLAIKKISFSLKTSTPNYSTGPCRGCKR